jgi:two-component system, OmpR family, response regulator VicR
MSRVLIVEDDQLLSSILATTFKNKGFEVECAYDGDTAVTRAIELHFDVMLLDILLPGKDGFEVISACSSMEATKHIPIIVISNLSDPATVERMKQLGAKSFIIKAHATPESIYEEVHRMLSS